MKYYETDIRVRYQETDQTGIVYHANYLTWFEIGRTEFIREVGYPYVEFEKRGLLLPVINVNIQYKSPAHYDDLVTIRTHVVRSTGVRIVFGYEVINRNTGVTHVKGETEHCWVNQQFRPTNLHKVWPEVATIIDELVTE